MLFQRALENWRKSAQSTARNQKLKSGEKRKKYKVKKNGYAQWTTRIRTVLTWVTEVSVHCTGVDNVSCRSSVGLWAFGACWWLSWRSLIARIYNERVLWLLSLELWAKFGFYVFFLGGVLTFLSPFLILPIPLLEVGRLPSLAFPSRPSSTFFP